VLLPAVLVARFQHPLLVRAAARAACAPESLAGRRVGVRSWSVTTGMWVRGILAEDHGVDAARVTWVTLEEPHVAGFRDPPNVERAPAGKDMVEMLIAGELDAAIVAERAAADARLAPVIADPAAAARAWRARHGGIQINHMVVVKESLTRSDPEAVREVWRLLVESRRTAGDPELNPYGVEANRRNLELAIERTHRQGLIARRCTVDQLFTEI
jgi:4,5-dihydroxyphthalate decarboxylase